jgi:hypothetical protein
MNLMSKFIMVTAALVAAVVVVPGGLARNPTPAELRALEIRGEALNQLCDNPTLVGQGYRLLCGTTGANNRPTPSALRALEIRGRGLNHLCDDGHLSSVAGYRMLCGNSVRVVTPASPEVPSANTFDWGDFGVGAGAGLGIVLLAGGVVGGLYYGRKGAVQPRSAS